MGSRCNLTNLTHVYGVHSSLVLYFGSVWLFFVPISSPVDSFGSLLDTLLDHVRIFHRRMGVYDQKWIFPWLSLTQRPLALGLEGLYCLSFCRERRHQHRRTLDFLGTLLGQACWRRRWMDFDFVGYKVRDVLSWYIPSERVAFLYGIQH